MRVAFTTWKKELKSYLFSPVGYIIAVLLYLYRGFEISSMTQRMAMGGGDVDQFSQAYVLQFSSLFMMVLVPPILTMRCFAEEKRTGSLEVLMTAPVRDWEIVLGKWGAAITFFLLLWLPTLLVVLFLDGPSYLNADISYGPVISGFLGMVLVGALLLAAGCFTSSLTDNQLLASLAAMLFGVLLLAGPSLLGPFLVQSALAEQAGLTGMDVVTGWISEKVFLPLVEQVNVFEHLVHWFARGLINTGHVVFYVAGTACLLFLTARSLEARRWR